jgi:AcrR family transcriptional regulator
VAGKGARPAGPGPSALGCLPLTSGWDSGVPSSHCPSGNAFRGVGGAIPCTSGRTGDGSPETRLTRRRQESRRRLVEAARDVIAERGIRDTPVELICERAGFTRGAFYSNFADKEELFLDVLRIETEVHRQRFADVLAGASDDVSPEDPRSVHEALTAIVQAYVTTRSDGEGWFILLTEIRLQAMRQPDLRQRFLEMFQAARVDLEAQVEDYIARIGARLTAPVGGVVRAVLALYDAALVDNVLAGRGLTADNEFLTEVIPQLFSGLIDLNGADTATLTRPDSPVPLTPPPGSPREGRRPAPGPG